MDFYNENLRLSGIRILDKNNKVIFRPNKLTFMNLIMNETRTVNMNYIETLKRVKRKTWS